MFEQGLIHTLYTCQLTDGSLAKKFSSTDDFHALLHTTTAGQIIKRLKAHFSVASGLEGLLREALDRRNFLVHRFFSERSELFLHVEGRILMLDELCESTSLFRRVEGEVQAVMFAEGSKFGLTKELTDQIFETMLHEAGGRSSSEIIEEGL